MQIIVMASEKHYHALPGFDHLFDKYFFQRTYPQSSDDYVLVGFAPPDRAFKVPWRFYSLGDFGDYPAGRWSDALLRVLDEVAHDQFILLLEDYWLTRPVDIQGVLMCFDYLRQFGNVLKIDLAHDRLYINGGANFYGGQGDYGHLGYLDLIKSPSGTQYQMSLWGGVWNSAMLREFVVPGETAQDLEINGTRRVNSVGDEVLVLGTRQAPLRHGNVYQSRHNGRPVYEDDGWRIDKAELAYMRECGWIAE